MSYTILRDVCLVEGASQEGVRKGCDLWLRGGSIEAITDSRARLPLKGEGEEIPCSGLYCLPGLIDMHTHVTSPGEERIEGSDDFRRLLAEHGRQALGAGVTTLRDLGGWPEVLLRLRAGVARSPFFPNLVVAGPFLTAPGGHPTIGLFHGLSALRRAATRELSEPEQARAVVDQLAASGVDFIKVVSTACLIVPQEETKVPKLRPEIFATIVAAAHARGLKVVAHTMTAADVREAVQVGCDGIEHGIVCDEIDACGPELLAQLRSRRICYVPTLAAIEQLAPRFLGQAMQNARRLAENGVLIGVGSDAGNPGVPFGAGLLRECELLFAAGIPPAQIIAGATSCAAEQLGRGGQLGHLSPGYQADLLLLRANPLEHPNNLRQIEAVFKAGCCVAARPASVFRRQRPSASFQESVS
ncbi:MAG: amidohydrolase family protein [Thermogemmatispora sp.]|uniref:amidohydrolase family protein n=1 Tax=Thermogemmatispora sp. TaxID=1968838 RepID=UPI0019FF3586|nr:amidohydrolase family protein [Thermogemmatispora sp.]MBE3565385.1 amidohydrolase family protein [Thermogemmatispora sp.]